MKKLIISCLVLFSVFICFASGHYHNQDTWTTNGTGSASYNLYNGTVAHCNVAGNGNGGNITYSITMYSMPNTSSAWSTYVNNGYRLKYIGGTHWYSASPSSWGSEPSNLNDYIYPSYVDYLRPY